MKRCSPWLMAGWLGGVGPAGAGELEIQDGQFQLDSSPVPPGCLALLAPQLNGDQVIASVFLERPSLRGCLAANESYPLQESGAPSPTYEIVESLSDSWHLVRICTHYAEGSLSTSCANLEIHFDDRSYQSPDGLKTVLTVSAVGEWTPVVWPPTALDFDAVERSQALDLRAKQLGNARRLTTEEDSRQCPDIAEDYVQITYRSRGDTVIDVQERFERGPELGIFSFSYDEGELIVADIDLAHPDGHSQDRIYFHEQRAFLCMQTHIGSAPEGFEEGKPQSVPCSQSLVQAALDHSQRLPQHRDPSVDFYADWCD